MSVWNTLSAGLHIVQEKLDHVLEGDEPDGGGEASGRAVDPDSAPTTPTVEPDQQPIVLSQPGSPKKTAKPSDIGATPSDVGEVESLRQALVESEQQLHLVNTEYRKLLKEKDSEIKSLKKKFSSGQSSTPRDDGPSVLEMAQKELAAHKEMVNELRKQLIEKEEEFQELNSKAETKFNKLKTQAKTKIATLNKEVERLRLEKGEESSFNISAMSLNESVSPSLGGVSPELESLKSEVGSKAKLIADLREELETLKGESDKMASQLATTKDRLNVSEVCLQKEKERVVKLELQAANLEEQVGQVSDELAHITDLREKALEELKNEKETKQILQAQVTDLTSKLEADHGMRQVPSFASSGVQVISEGTSQVDSEEDAVTSDKSGSPIQMASSLSTVLATGSRGSLLDLEAELKQLECSLHERDEQLSSFKAILEEREERLQAEQQNTSNLTTKLKEITAAMEGKIQELQNQLASCHGDLELHRVRVESLEATNKEILAQNESYSVNIADFSRQVNELTSSLSEAKSSREEFVKEISSLQSELQAHKDTVAQKQELLSQKDCEIEGMQQTIQQVQSTYKTLQSSLTSDRQSSGEKLAENLRQIQELEERVVELQQALASVEQEKMEIEHTNTQLEETLQFSKDTSQKEYSNLESSLVGKVAEKEELIKELEEKVEKQATELTLSGEKIQTVLRDLSEKEERLSSTEMKLQELLEAKKELEKRSNESSEKHARVVGALEFAQQELSTRENTIKGLSQALEEKKASISSLESEVAHIKSENADKLTEVMRRSEEALQTRSSLEGKLSQLERELEKKESELCLGKETTVKLQTENEKLQQELVVVTSQLSVLEREKESAQIEHETLRGQVENLSRLESSFSQEHNRYETELSDLKAQLTQSTGHVAELQQKLRNAKAQLQKAAKLKQEFNERREQLEADLDKYKRENEQMKLQFDSAVKLMEAKSAEQASALAQSSLQISEKDSQLVSLHDQLSFEQQTTSQLKEKVSKLSADYKVSTERCRLLEQERVQLNQKISDMSDELGHLGQSLSDIQLARDSLKLEHETLVQGAQERESKVIELTQQLGQLAREKEGYENKLRELSRQLVVNEQSKLSLGAELEELRRRKEEVQDWEREKQALLEDRKSLEQERSALRSTESLLQSQVSQLQARVEQLQQELRASHSELESSHRGSETTNASLVEELQRRLATLQEAHLTETSRLQQSLQQETEKRELAEKTAEELKGEVAISMEGMGPDTGGEGQSPQPQNFMGYVEMAKAWFQRFIKNPNVVLMRLYRATPQTKLFFLAYFVLLHLLLLYLFLV